MTTFSRIKKFGIGFVVVALIGSMLVFAGCQAPATDKPADTGAASEQTNTPPAPPAAPAVELQIFAANSLDAALPAVQDLYTSKHPNVTFADTQFLASGDLVEKIKGGATPDLLITASAASMDTAVQNGGINEATRVNMFTNDLVIVVKKDSPLTITSLDIVKDPSITSIAIGDGASVPAGQYANQSLNSIGLYSDASGKGGDYDASIVGKVKTAAKVGDVANYVATGDAQIGFVYSSDIYRSFGTDIKAAFTVPADSHKQIIYPGAALTASQNADAAKDFLDFCLNDPDALAIWAQYGFEMAK
jgi:molybdate transport system substrate-binding protein